MPEAIHALPVSVEQIAVAVKQMNQTEKQRLLELVPDLREIPTTKAPKRASDQAKKNIALLQKEIMIVLKNKLLSTEELFLGNLTLGQYNALSEEEKKSLWDELADLDLMELEEQEVSPNAMSAG